MGRIAVSICWRGLGFDHPANWGTVSSCTEELGDRGEWKFSRSYDGADETEIHSLQGKLLRAAKLALNTWRDVNFVSLNCFNWSTVRF